MNLIISQLSKEYKDNKYDKAIRDLNSLKDRNKVYEILEELYESPYDAFETGEVIQYDDNGNPKKIELNEGNESIILSLGDAINADADPKELTMIMMTI